MTSCGSMRERTEEWHCPASQSLIALGWVELKRSGPSIHLNRKVHFPK